MSDEKRIQCSSLPDDFVSTRRLNCGPDNPTRIAVRVCQDPSSEAHKRSACVYLSKKRARKLALALLAFSESPNE